MTERVVVRVVSAGQVDAAERLAIVALGWISDDIDRVGGFIDRTGIRADRIRQAAGSRDFLLGVLEHIMSDEEWLLLPFCAVSKASPREVCEARDVLASPYRIKHGSAENMVPKILPRRGFS
ncbi:DUF3572 domain-containing protein [Bosea thiooxidans]